MQSLTVDTNCLNVLRRDSFNFNQINIFLVKKIVKFAFSSCKKTKGLLERPSLSRGMNVSALHEGPVVILIDSLDFISKVQTITLQNLN